MDGLTLRKILSALLVILLSVPLGFCDDGGGRGKDKGQGDGRQGGGSGGGGNNQKGLLPGRCAGTQASWWKALITTDGDPCQVHGKLLDQGVSTVCCIFPFSGACGPCNLQSYNIAAACLLCSELPGEQVPSQTVVQDARYFKKFSQWTGHGGTGGSLPAEFNNISWVNTPVTDDLFDAASAARTGESFLQMSTLSSKTPNASSTSETASYTDPAATSSYTANTPKEAKEGTSPRHNAAAMAGGTIGAFVVIALVITAVVLYRRRRRAKLAPSTQFMAVARPMEAYNFGTSSRRGSGDPIPFTPGAWTQTTTEKEQITPQMQRDYDAGIYSRTYAYGA